MPIAIDTLSRFTVEHADVRGELVHLDETWREAASRYDYPMAVQKLLGEAMAAIALLSATIKFEGKLSLQLRGDGPLKLLIAEATGPTTLRALARWEGDTQDMAFADIVGNAYLIIDIDPGDGRERYQGIVAIEADSLAGVLEGYFENSEQLPTRFWLTSNAESSAGLLLQRLPGADVENSLWSRLAPYTDRLTDEAIIGMAADDLLPKLFYDRDVRLFDAEPIDYRCGCTRERVEQMLRALGEVELKAILAEEGQIKVNCEFCGNEYCFDAVDVGMLSAERATSGTPQTRH